jgi:DNA modification methylase
MSNDEVVGVAQAGAGDVGVLSDVPNLGHALPPLVPQRFIANRTTGDVGKRAKVPNTPFVSVATNGNLHVDPELRKTSAWDGEPMEVTAARKKEIKAAILSKSPSALRTVYYWSQTSAILVGCEFFEFATELALVPGVDYPIKAVSCESLQAARIWRYEHNITRRQHLHSHVRALQAIELYGDELERLQAQARQNRTKALKGEKTASAEKIDRLQFLAGKAGVSRATMGRVWPIYLESKRDPNDPNPKKRRAVSYDRLDTMLRELDADDTCLKSVYLNTKHERERKFRHMQGTTLAPEPSPGFSCDADFDPAKQSQIICGDSLILMQRWARLALAARPSPHVVCGSPPYWLPRPDEDDNPDEGTGRILYGKRVQEMWERLGVKSFEDYVERFLRPYIMSSYELLPDGGTLAIQVDNTRGRDERGNRIVLWHTDEIRRIGKSLGFIPCPEIIWRKNEISGKRSGFGGRNTRAVRETYEYIVAMRKNTNRIVGDFEKETASFHRFTVNYWELDPGQAKNLTEEEKLMFLSPVWEIGAARDSAQNRHAHPAAYPIMLPYGIIKLFVPIGGMILDPWNGTGTTCAAAVLTGRRYIGIDIEPYNCELGIAKVERTTQFLPKLQEQMRQKLRKRLIDSLGIDPDAPVVTAPEPSLNKGDNNTPTTPKNAGPSGPSHVRLPNTGSQT